MVIGNMEIMLTLRTGIGFHILDTMKFLPVTQIRL
jgi:hypothetical protein